MNALEIFKLILNGFEVAACITGFIYWKKIRQSHWKWFPVYLAFIVVAEFTGKYLTQTNGDTLKVAMYDYLVIPAEIFFYLFIFYNEFKHTKAVRLPLSGMLVYTACLLIDSFYLHNKYDYFLSFSYTTGVILIVVNILMFLFRLVVSNGVIYFRSNIAFWVCIGLLLFYLGSIPFQGFFNTLYNKYNEVFMSYVYLFYTFNCLMYLSFIIAFVCGKTKPPGF